MDEFNSQKYFEDVKSKIGHDQTLLDTIKELEKAWDKGDKKKVKMLSERLCSTIPMSVITESQRNILFEMQKGKKKKKKTKKVPMALKLKREVKEESEPTIEGERTGEHLEVKAESEPTVEGERTGEHLEVEEESEPTVEVERTSEHLEEVAESEPTVEGERTGEHLTSVEGERQVQIEARNNDAIESEKMDQQMVPLKDAAQELTNTHSEQPSTRIEELSNKLKTIETVLERHRSELLTKKQENRTLTEKASRLNEHIKRQSEKEQDAEEESKHLKRQIEELKDDKDQAFKNFQNQTKEESERRKDVEERMKSMELKIGKLKADQKKSELEREKLEENLKREIKTLQADKDKLLSKRKPKSKEVIKQNEEMKQTIETLKSERYVQQSSYETLKESLQRKDISLQRSKTSLDESNKKNEQLVTRLSKIAGTKLMHNNPNIADLSDKDRPTKLGEKYSELYDNEYTEAFTALNEAKTRTDEEIITFLLEILLDCFTVCMEKSNDQMSYIKSILLFPSKIELKSPEEIHLTKEQEKMVTDLRKQTVEITHKDLFQNIITRHKTASLPQEVVKFIGCCTELCWKMVVQTPPLYLDVTDSKHDVFKRDVYKPYTKMGRRIQFVVWPPLYLHEHGPLLCKGTAQGGE